MILKGNARGGAKDLALHLMKTENEHVEVHELRGFVSENLMGALNEAYAISRGTRCRQFLYSLSLNPPKTDQVTTAQFEVAIERAEEKLGLTGQPRAIVFHEKDGRRHAHAVWSRIDIGRMKAVHLFRDHEKLMTVSRELFREHGWKMPEGLADRSRCDPRNFTLEEWQQAKRAGKDASAIKTAFQDAWAISDTGTAFIRAMHERGYVVARGDRRGFVAVDVHGEVYAIRSYAGVKTKAVRARLGDENALPDVDEARAQIAGDMLPAFARFRDALDTQANVREAEFEKRCRALVASQRAERQRLCGKQDRRHAEENRIRQARFRTGLKGLWDFLRGEHKRIRQQNEHEAQDALARDRAERDRLVFRHLQQRRQLEFVKLHARLRLAKDRRVLERESQVYKVMNNLKSKGQQPDL